MSTKAITMTEYIVDQDGSVSFYSPIYNLTLPLKSMGWQFKWESGVLGTFLWEASIYPGPYSWESLVVCETVSFTIDSSTTNESCIVVLPDQWQNVGYIRFGFVPATGSTGLIQTALRVVPT